MDRKQIPKQFSLSEFKQELDGMVSKNTGTYINTHDQFWGGRVKTKTRTLQELQDIVSNGNITVQRALSNEFFNSNGFYRQIVMHYGTLLKNVGILIPNPSYGKSLQDKPIAKRYYGALDLIESMVLESRLTDLSIRVLLNGVYYGVIHTSTKKDFILMDLPIEYCRSELQDSKNRDIIEFNTAYFDSIRDANARRMALRAYPDFIAEHYYKTKEQRGLSAWMKLPVELGVSFQLFSQRPYFLPLVPITLQYDDAVERDAEREREEIKKVLVQEMPHLNDGSLVFEPDEAAIMHEGTVGMLAESNPNMSVLTTYGKADVVQTKTSSGITRNTLEQMTKHVYASAGVTSEVFSATGAAAVKTSLQYDTSIMMILGNQYASFISRVMNATFGNTHVDFKYSILPITIYNSEDYVNSTFKLAQSGYPLLLPAIAHGVSQRDLTNLKDLENNLLGLPDSLIPSQSAYTQTKDGGSTDEGGRPQLKQEEKAEKTLENEESLDKGGE